MASKNFKLALDDIRGGFLDWRIWSILGWQDIKLRYRRSQLGPFWITLSTAIMVYSMGFLYGTLFRVNLAEYYPYLASGVITWTLISHIITESNDAFMQSHVYIKQIKLKYSIFILQILTRNFIILFHNLLALLPILIIFHVHISMTSILYLFFGFVLIFICGLSYGTIFAILGTRYRDIKQIINSFTQVIFMLTPIMWQAKMLPQKYMFAANLNPFNQIIELIRNPLTGNSPSLYTILFCLMIVIMGLLIQILLLWRSRHRIPFWI